jgi:hypothetical protein
MHHLQSQIGERTSECRVARNFREDCYGNGKSGRKNLILQSVCSSVHSPEVCDFVHEEMCKKEPDLMQNAKKLGPMQGESGYDIVQLQLRAGTGRDGTSEGR